MGWESFRTGVFAPDGYAETWNAYKCDVPGCEHEAVDPYDFDKPHSGLCDSHIEEAAEADRDEEFYRDVEG